jgi:hypothetical protein
VEGVLRIHWLVAQLLGLHSCSLLSNAAEQQLQGCSGASAALEAWQLYGGAVATGIQVGWQGLLLRQTGRVREHDQLAAGQGCAMMQ